MITSGGGAGGIGIGVSGIDPAPDEPLDRGADRGAETG